MSRNIQFQHLRGTQAQLSTLIAGIDPDTGASVNPLQFGELYFATDTMNVFMGTPGIGIGYVQIGDTRQVNETLLQVLSELRCMRLALTQLACEGGRAKPQDFDPVYVASDSEVSD